MKTAQQIFDTTLNHLRKQGVAAVSFIGHCRYRGENGTSCAVGCLIPEEAYAFELEGLRAGASSVMAATGLAANYVPLLRDLQGAHDSALKDRGLEAWEDSMKYIALQHSLTYTAAK